MLHSARQIRARAGHVLLARVGVDERISLARVAGVKVLVHRGKAGVRRQQDVARQRLDQVADGELWRLFSSGLVVYLNVSFDTGERLSA